MNIWRVTPSLNGYELNNGHIRSSCIIGKTGMIDADKKREGDMATPIGTWPMRCLYYRPDRLEAPPSDLPTYAITPDLGWCDDPDDPAYNCLIKRPFAARHETLWRDDNRYDLLVVLGYNDDPPQAGRGSAIFFHLCEQDTAFTAGCVAILQHDMLEMLKRANTRSAISISNSPPPK